MLQLPSWWQACLPACLERRRADMGFWVGWAAQAVCQTGLIGQHLDDCPLFLLLFGACRRRETAFLERSSGGP